MLPTRGLSRGAALPPLSNAAAPPDGGRWNLPFAAYGFQILACLLEAPSPKWLRRAFRLPSKTIQKLKNTHLNGF